MFFHPRHSENAGPAPESRAQAVFGAHPVQDPGLVAQAVIGQAFEGEGDAQVVGVEGVFKHRYRRERTVDDAIGVIPLG